ncbi:hypothetical protein J7438_06970 [Thalassotalea sp. G20_0]|uniref:hypothetical protein n=1 Tax=Thalassotalea sp. G20_0 TaxID=2821093 RepID=UPI001AD95704|nr:hypothetical protein [Thalassotalea sp. G20_0]MBO9493826.1 hypothetical protein [Thalassotalea sp. G20_0]
MKSNDLLGFRCHFYPGAVFPKCQHAAKCRPAFWDDKDRCPGVYQCKKPEAERVKQVNQTR